MEDDLYFHTDVLPSVISIHVLRVEDDRGQNRHTGLYSYFNPRPPCGGRRACNPRRAITAEFQSTSSVWRTTAVLVGQFGVQHISIHVLRVEDDGKDKTTT